MIRSFARTFFAVTLRICLGALFALPVGFEDGDRAISFLCCVPNRLAAERCIRATRAAPGDSAGLSRVSARGRVPRAHPPAP